MNDMTFSGHGGAMALNEEFDPYAEYGREAGVPIVGKLIKFSKGDYIVGKDFLPEGQRFIVNMPSIARGWIKWVDSKPEEQIMGLLKDGHKPQKRDTLGSEDETEWEVDDKGVPQDPWKETNIIVFKEEHGEQLYTFSTASHGGRGAIRKLCEAYAQGRRMRPGQHPIIAIHVDRYEHSNKAFGWIKNPEFKIVSWAAADSFGDAAAAGDDAFATETRRIQNMASEKTADKMLGTGATKF
jgi:hypothetical protein